MVPFVGGQGQPLRPGTRRVLCRQVLQRRPRSGEKGYLAKEGVSSHFLNEMSQQTTQPEVLWGWDGRSQASNLEMIK